MVDGVIRDFVEKVRNHWAVHKIKKSSVSNVRHHLMIHGTFGGFLANMHNDVEDHRTLNGFVRKSQNHLVIFETREYSALNIRIQLTIRGTLEGFKSNI